MTLPASGSISLSQVNTELSKSATATISLNDTDVRTLAGIASGTISLASLWGKSASTTKGYWGGDFINGTTVTNDIAGLTFSTETLFDPSAALSVARVSNVGVGSSTKAYWAGGSTSSSTPSAEIDGLVYSTQTAINPSATLAVARSGAYSVATSTKGYWGGGGHASYLSEIDGIIFSTETAHNPSATLSSPRVRAGTWSTSTKGYWAGGAKADSTWSNTIDSFLFSSESVSVLSSTLPTDPNTSQPLLMSPDTHHHSSVAGYASVTSLINTYSIKLTFNTETLSTPSTAPTAKTGNICTQSSEKGYQTAGSVQTFSYPTWYTVNYKTTTTYTFTTETTGSMTAEIAQASRSGYGNGVSGY